MPPPLVQRSVVLQPILAGRHSAPLLLLLPLPLLTLLLWALVAVLGCVLSALLLALLLCMVRHWWALMVRWGRSRY